MIDFFKILLKFKLRHIFYFTLVISALISIAIFSIFFYKLYINHLKENLIQNLKVKIALATELIERNLNKPEISEVEAVISYLSTVNNVEAIFLINKDGKILFSSSRKYIGKSIENIIKDLDIKNLISEKLSYTLSKDKRLLYLVNTVYLKSKKSIRPMKQAFLIVVYNYQKDINTAKIALIQSLIVFIISVLVAGFILDIIFKNYISQRIEIITNALDKVSKGNLDARINVFGNDEIKIIAEKVNEMISKLKSYVYYDYLTGVLNRYYFEKKVNAEIEKNSRFAIVMFDTDNFKEINDLFGHFIGDKLLQQYALRLENTVNKNGFVGRFGGDEFIVLLNECCYKNDTELKLYVKEILKVLDEPFFIDNYKIDITSTAGIAKYPEHAQNFEDLLKIADIALYHGKEIGKNIAVIANDEIVRKNIRKAEITSHIRDAIEKKEFYLLYQPIFDSKTLKITGVEALLRWNSPTLGFISPAEFIPILEETGLIKEVGKWIFFEVLRQAVIWENQGIENIKINVNVDVQQLLQANFYKFLKDEILSKNFDKLKLGIEITESEAMQYPELIIEILKQLRVSGVVISIDDFGTGNSSLSYLKTMNVDYIKIDKSFVNGLPDDEHSVILVKTIINLAKTFGYKTVAEGVETAKQVEYLKSVGCDELQGFFFSKPVSPEEIVNLYKKFNQDTN